MRWHRARGRRLTRILAHFEIRIRQQILRRELIQVLAQLIRAHCVDAFAAFVQPVEQSIQIRLRVDAVQRLVTIVE